MVKFEYEKERPTHFIESEAKIIKDYKDILEKYPNEEIRFKWDGLKYLIETNVEVAPFFYVKDSSHI